MDLIGMVFNFNEQIIGVTSRPLALVDEPRKKWLVKALQEEVQEYQDAWNAGDVIGAIDAMIDHIYFAIGELKHMGLTHEQAIACFTAVHEANMTKKRGVKATRATDGYTTDAIKPVDWQSPEDRLAIILGMQPDWVKR